MKPTMTTENQPARMGDDLIASLVWKHLRGHAETLTFDRSPEYFPQASYKVPVVGLSNFVQAVIEAHESARELSAHGGDGGDTELVRWLENMANHPAWKGSLGDSQFPRMFRDAALRVAFLATQQTASGDSGVDDGMVDVALDGFNEAAADGELLLTSHRDAARMKHALRDAIWHATGRTTPAIAAHGGSGEGPSIGKIIANNYTKYWHDEPPTSASDSEAVPVGWLYVRTIPSPTGGNYYDTQFSQARWTADYLSVQGAVEQPLFTSSPARVGGESGVAEKLYQAAWMAEGFVAHTVSVAPKPELAKQCLDMIHEAIAEYRAQQASGRESDHG